MNIVNLTPHDITFVVGDQTVVIPSSGIARAREQKAVIGEIELPDGNRVPVYEIRYGEPEGVPAPQPGTVYIVSALTAQAVRQHQPERDDVFVVADPVRDEHGRIVGARALARV